MFGRVVNLQFGGQPPNLRRWERRIQRGHAVGIERVHDEHDPFGVLVVDIHQCLDALSELQPRAACANGHVTPAPQLLGD
jgi:hypothetical protein